MFKKNNLFQFLKTESSTVMGAAIMVGIFAFLSRMIGFVRDRILAALFGAGNTLDIYYAAFKIPDLLFNLVVIGSLSASFIPLFTKYYQRSFQKSHAWKFTNAILHLVAFGMIGLACILFIFSDQISAFIAPGFDSIKQARVASFSRVMLIAQIFLAISMVYGGVLQSMKRFFLYSLAPIFYNLGIIFGAIFFVKWFGMIGLAYGVVFGAFLHLCVQGVGLIGTGYTYHWSFDVKDADTRFVLKTMFPRMIGIGVNQLLFLILTIIASTLPIGSVTIFQFAYNVEFFPIGIFGVSLAIAVFPTFSEHLASHNTEKFQTVFASTIRQILFFMIPATIMFLLLRAQIIRLVVGAGEFDWNATILAADTLAFFALTFIPQSCVYILARAFFAMRDTVTPLTTGLVSALLGIMSAFVFTRMYGVTGLAIAFGISETVNATLLWVFLKQKIGSLHESFVLEGFFKFIPAALMSGIVMYFTRSVVSLFIELDTFIHVFIQLFCTILAGGSVYAFVLWILRSEELFSFMSLLKRRKLFAAPQTEVVSSSDTASPG